MLWVKDNNEWNNQITTNLQAVQNAISKIEELVCGLIKSDYYTAQVQTEIQQLASWLMELQAERSRLRDEFEAQTINVSAKRHVWKTKTVEFRTEMEGAIVVARNEQVLAIESLRSRLRKVSIDAEKTKKEDTFLQQENESLISMQGTVTKQYDTLIAVLNQKMNLRTTEQIKVNETRKLVRKTSLLADEYGLGIRNVQEDMNVFHAKHGEKHQKVEAEVAEIKEAIVKQEQANEYVKQPADELQVKIDEMEKKLEGVRGEVSKTEKSKARLTARCTQMIATIDQEKFLNQRTEEEVVILQASLGRQRIEYIEKITELKRKRKLADGQFEETEEERAILQKEKERVLLQEQEARQQKLKSQAVVQDIICKLKKTKREIISCQEKTALISQDNTKTRQNLLTLRENHTATVEMFSQQISDYKMNLKKARTEKAKTKEEEEETEKILDHFNLEQIRFVKDINMKIQESQNRHKYLISEYEKFEEDKAVNMIRAETLKDKLKMAEMELRGMKYEFGAVIEKLKNSTDMFSEENKKKERFIKGKCLALQEIEANLEQVEREYSCSKDEVIAVRNREKSLQEQIKRTKLLLTRLAEPHDKLKNDIESCRTESLDQLKQSVLESQVVEAEIYDRTQKLENTLEENEKFQAWCVERAETIKDICMDIKAHGRHQESLTRDLQELQKKFVTTWDICAGMEMESAEHDTQILNGIMRLRQETKERHLALTDLSVQLNVEMERLTAFIESEPKIEKKEKRKSMKPHLLHEDERKEKRKSLKPKPPLVINRRQRKSSTPLNSQAQRKFTLPAIPAPVPFHLRAKRKLTMPAIPSSAQYDPRAQRKLTLTS